MVRVKDLEPSYVPKTNYKKNMYGLGISFIKGTANILGLRNKSPDANKLSAMKKQIEEEMGKQKSEFDKFSKELEKTKSKEQESTEKLQKAKQVSTETKIIPKEALQETYMSYLKRLINKLKDQASSGVSKKGGYKKKITKRNRIPRKKRKTNKKKSQTKTKSKTKSRKNKSKKQRKKRKEKRMTRKNK